MTRAIHPVPGSHQAFSAIEHARMDDLRDSIAVLPDPAEYVYSMPDWMVESLLCAERRGSTLFLPPSVAAVLRPFGLVDFCTPALTAFGAAVFRALAEEAN